MNKKLQERISIFTKEEKIFSSYFIRSNITDICEDDLQVMNLIAFVNTNKKYPNITMQLDYDEMKLNIWSSKELVHEIHKEFSKQLDEIYRSTPL
jgi:hypothetical protein